MTTDLRIPDAGLIWVRCPNETLKACGNGVVWQQAVAALTFLRLLSATH